MFVEVSQVLGCCNQDHVMTPALALSSHCGVCQSKQDSKQLPLGGKESFAVEESANLE